MKLKRIREKKYYCLVEFPYASGEGLHAGHPRSYTALDIVSRKRRLEGYNVLYPIGFDSFGLPTENYAIKTKIQPQIITEKNIKFFTQQLKSLGFSFDWSRTFSTADSDYYRWTQWIFIKMFEKGLAYKAKENINWCVKCQIGLANEEVVGGACERCGGEVVKKEKEQWVLKITQYADRLIDDLEKVDYLERIKTQQINWIGRSEGADVDFKISAQSALGGHGGFEPASGGKDSDIVLKVFTTRPDTLFGATFMVIAPEHELINQLKEKITNIKEVEQYVKTAKKKSDLERTMIEKVPTISQSEMSGSRLYVGEKTGVELKGVKAINPVNNQEIPVFVADYVLAGYGSGAIMAVPAHDDRDFEFAKKYNIDIIQVVREKNITTRSYLMGADNISDDDLRLLGIRIMEKTTDGDRKLEIPKENLKKYEELIKEKLTPGFWNEYVGEEIVFIFKYKDGKIERYILNNETEGKIDKLAAEFVGEKWAKSCVWKWLAENKLYTSLIITTCEGISVNSDFLNGLETQKAKKKTIQWLEKEKLGPESGQLSSARLDFFQAKVLGRAHSHGFLREMRPPAIA